MTASGVNTVTTAANMIEIKRIDFGPIRCTSNELGNSVSRPPQENDDKIIPCIFCGHWYRFSLAYTNYDETIQSVFFSSSI